MREIDFSPLHDKLIRRPDGRLLPMDEPCYEVREIASGTWQILSSGDYHYLLAGEGEAVSIDTGYGAGNLREFLEELCGLPVKAVINTHDHFDHTANNCYFDRVYLSYESLPLVTRPFPSFKDVSFPRNYNTHVVGDGDKIPLPGRELEIIKIADHAAGSIAILDRRERLLFSGDEFMPFGKWLNGTAENFLRNMEKIMAHRHEFELLCGGPGIMDAEEAEIHYEAAKLMLTGGVGEDTPPKAPPPLENEIIDGHVVYDCRAPRPEDRGGGEPTKIKSRPHFFVHRGRYFEFDKAKLFDEAR